jgi:hypothetical protein
MDKFDNVEEIISSNPITNCIVIEHYDIGCKFHIKFQCSLSLSTIPCIIQKRRRIDSKCKILFPTS